MLDQTSTKRPMGSPLASLHCSTAMPIHVAANYFTDGIRLTVYTSLPLGIVGLVACLFCNDGELKMTNTTGGALGK